MSHTLSGVLVNLARAYGRDPKALVEVHCIVHAYFHELKYGLTKSVMESLLLDLQNNPFSLNIDEINTYSFDISISPVKIHSSDTAKSKVSLAPNRCLSLRK